MKAKNIFFNSWYSFFLIFTLIIGFFSCGGSEEGELPVKEGKPYNVLLISIDTCRADYIETYGADMVETPHIDALAEDGIVFEDASTPVPLTLPAHATLLTGLHPIQHQVRDNYNNALSETADTLPELFQESDYLTMGAIATILLSRRSGLGQGFDEYSDVFKNTMMAKGSPMVEKRGSEILQAGTKWLLDYVEQREDNPFFQFLHFYDPHTPYSPPEPFLSEYEENKYAGEIAYVDDCLGQLFDFLKTANLYEELLIILIGDHGEGLGDHEEQTHGLFVYEESMHVPFIVKLPASMEAEITPPKRISQSVGLQDVMPTIIELCELGPVNTYGKSLVPWIHNEAETQERSMVFETQYPLTYNWSPLYALRNQQWKFVQAPDAELYNLQKDPGEQNNIIHEEDDKKEELQKQLEEQIVELSNSSPITREERTAVGSTEILSSLGYVGGSVKKPDDDDVLPDPKYKITIHNIIERGLNALNQGQQKQAIEHFLKAVRQDPRNPSPYYNLGLAYYYMQQWEIAMEYTKQAVELAPESVLIHLQLSRIAIRREEYDNAKEILKTLLEENSKLADAYFQLGWIALEEKNYEEALEHFKEARLWMPEMQDLKEAIERAKKHLDT